MAGDGLTASMYNSLLTTLKGTAFGSSTTSQWGFTQLHTGDPGAAGTSNVSAGSTTRQATSFGTASGGSIGLSASPTAWTNGGTSETITNISGWTAASAGTFIGSVTLTTPKAWASGDTLTLNTLTISMTPVAS